MVRFPPPSVGLGLGLVVWMEEDDKRTCWGEVLVLVSLGCCWLWTKIRREGGCVSSIL